MSRLGNVLNSSQLNSTRTLYAACVLVPIIFGFYSVFLGQDRNWDLLNYHWYDGFAYWNNKHSIDLAPAGMQTYFNPTLDAFYYLLFAHLPAPVVGFILGLLHGLNFVLVLIIARLVLAGLPDQDRIRIPLLLAAAGLLTANFLTSLGNTMGDNLTALFCLGGLAAVIAALGNTNDQRKGRFKLILLGGLLVGLGTGLKLTNGVYAFAMAGVLLLCSLDIRSRLASSFGFSCAVLIGFGLAAGHWHYQMWQTWGNPLFPQFSSIFPNPITPSVGVVDTVWTPKSLTDTLLWPILFSIDSSRVGQLPIRQVIWAVAYISFIAWAATSVARRFSGGSIRYESMPRATRALIVFVVLGYVLWMILFSIYRYIVPIELLLPLFIFLVIYGLFEFRKARRISLILIAVSTAVVLAGGATTWGHEGWATPPFRADLPPLDDPGRTTVVIPMPDPPMGWMAATFPPSVAFTQIDPSFPRTPVYHQKVYELIRSRSGPLYALFDASHNSRIEQIERIQRVASFLGLDRTASRCERLNRYIARLRLRAAVGPSNDASTDRACQIEMRPQDRRDLTAEDAVRARVIADGLARYGLIMDPAKCLRRAAYIGDGERPYQWCPLELRL